jgi:hypothetical protein
MIFVIKTVNGLQLTLPEFTRIPFHLIKLRRIIEENLCKIIDIHVSISMFTSGPLGGGKGNQLTRAPRRHRDHA